MNPRHIYVELLDEGTFVWRPVSATHIRDLIFKIEGNVPEGETWAFQPGEIVECEPHKLSEGTQLMVIRSLSSY
jgi:hypothetical protein